MEKVILVLLLIGVFSVLLGYFINMKSFTKRVENFIFYLALICEVIFMFITYDKMKRNYIIVSFGGFILGFLIKHIRKSDRTVM